MARSFDEYAALPKAERLALARAGIVFDFDSLVPIERTAVQELLARGERRLVGDRKNRSGDPSL